MKDINKSIVMWKNLTFPDLNYSTKLTLEHVCLDQCKNNAFNLKYANRFFETLHILYYLIFMHIVVVGSSYSFMLQIGNLKPREVLYQS